MFDARERPRGRNDKDTHILLNDQFSVYLRKPEIVADAKTKAQITQGKAAERITRNKTLLFFNGCNRIQMGCWIAEQTRNLSGRNLHMNPPTKQTKGRENSYLAFQHLFPFGAFCVFRRLSKLEQSENVGNHLQTH